MKKLISVILIMLLLTACDMTGTEKKAPVNHTPDGNEVTASGEITVRSSNIEKDIEALTTGYETITLNKKGVYIQNPTAVETMSTNDNPDGTKTYTFTIADDLYFSDGSKVNARDYVFSVLALKNIPELSGYDAYLNGETNIFRGVRLLAENRFSLTLRADAIPHYYEAALMSVSPLPVAVICPDYKLSDSADGVIIENLDADKVNAFLKNPTVSSGAYVYENGILRANPYFKGNYEEQKPSIEKITLVPLTSSAQADLIPDVAEAVNGYKNTLHPVSEITTLFSGCDFRNDESLVSALRPYFNEGDEELLKIADYLLETAEFNVTELTEKWESIPHLNPEASIYDNSLERIRGFNSTSNYWNWTDQILYCFIARE